MDGGVVLAGLALLVILVLLAAANLVLLARRGGEAGATDALRRALEASGRAEAEAVRGAIAGAERALLARGEQSGLAAQAALGELTTRLVREQGEQRLLIAEKLREMGAEAAQRLAAIQHSVNAQLAESIDKQMQGSFQRVIDQFGLVQKAMTDVQAVTGQIGDLKRLFSNVKSRGGGGEGQLRAILVDILPDGAWEANRKLRADSDEVVEFVLVMPAQGRPRPVLALDAKFPSEDYDRLLLAAEAGLADEERVARKALEARLRAEAKKIASKYIVPPVTVDFAVMYLPTDGLYVEAARMPGLIESLGREHRVLVMGPALLPGLVRSVHIGAMSLTIAENAERIQHTLGAVRTEFRRIDEVLGKLEKQTGLVNRTVSATRVRTRAMERTLRKVEVMAAEEAEAVLQIESAALELEEDEAGQ